jgi:hypothetical protein
VQPETRHARLGIVFDRRGTGASDPQPSGSLPPWEAYAQDPTAVLDEVGSQQAALPAQFDQFWGTEAMAAPATRASAAGSPGSSAPVASPRMVQAFLRANLEMDARPWHPSRTGPGRGAAAATGRIGLAGSAMIASPARRRPACRLVESSAAADRGGP